MKTIQIIVKILGGLAVSLGINIAAHAGTQGVSDAQIVLGSHQPLSGPLAGWGVPTTNGMRMRVEEINSAGGINGRKMWSTWDTMHDLLEQGLIDVDAFKIVGLDITPPL